MKIYLIFASLIPMLAFGSESSPAATCAKILAGDKATSIDSLRIGVRVIGADHKPRILLGNYFTGGHKELLLEAQSRFGATTATWLGEARVTTDGGLKIIRANEFAGRFKAFHDGYYTDFQGMHFPIPEGENLPLTNSFESLGLSVRAPTFKGEHFHPASTHLDDLFGSKTDNIRHATSGGIQQVQAIYIYGHYLKSERTVIEERDKIRETIASTQRVIRYMIDHQILVQSEAQVLVDVIDAIQADPPNMEYLKNLPEDELLRVSDHVRDLKLEIFEEP